MANAHFFLSSVQKRGGKGLKTLQITEKNGPIVAAKIVRDGDELMLISHEGTAIRVKADEISIMGRSTQGVRVMTMDEGDAVASMAKIATRDDEVDDSGETGSDGEAPDEEEPSLPDSEDGYPLGYEDEDTDEDESDEDY